MHHVRSSLLAVVLLAVSCAGRVSSEAPGPASAASVPPETAGLIASCGNAAFQGVPPATAGLARFDSFDGLDLSRVGGEAPYFREFVARYDWFVTDEGDGWRELFGQPTTPPEDPPDASMRLEMRDGAWAPVGWGQCRIELEADGWGNARFVMDPTYPPDPASGRISVLATEMACASGQAPDGRVVRSVILDQSERTVSVVILVEPSHAASDCQSNPAFPFEVDLGSPLGDRKILDASVYPAMQRWP